MSMPEHWKLLSMQGIFDCRCTRLAPCRTLPNANTHTQAYPYPLPRCCKLDRIDNIAQENGLISEEEMVGSVEYLVLGHFKREERDEYGTRTMAMAWLTPADFDNSSTVSKPQQEIDETLDEWEMLGVRVREEARRLQRQAQQAREVARLARDVESEDSRIP